MVKSEQGQFLQPGLPCALRPNGIRLKVGPSSSALGYFFQAFAPNMSTDSSHFYLEGYCSTFMQT